VLSSYSVTHEPRSPDVCCSLFHGKWQDCKGCKADSLVSSALTHNHKNYGLENSAKSTRQYAWM